MWEGEPTEVGLVHLLPRFQPPREGPGGWEVPNAPDAPVRARAQVLTGPGRFELRELEVPPPGPGELRLHVHACGICGTDKVLAQTCGAGTVLGHEVIAEVESCGPDVT